MSLETGSRTIDTTAVPSWARVKDIGYQLNDPEYQEGTKSKESQPQVRAYTPLFDVDRIFEVHALRGKDPDLYQQKLNEAYALYINNSETFIDEMCGMEMYKAEYTVHNGLLVTQQGESLLAMMERGLQYAVESGYSRGDIMRMQAEKVSIATVQERAAQGGVGSDANISLAGGSFKHNFVDFFTYRNGKVELKRRHTNLSRPQIIDVSNAVSQSVSGRAALKDEASVIDIKAAMIDTTGVNEMALFEQFGTGSYKTTPEKRVFIGRQIKPIQEAYWRELVTIPPDITKLERLYKAKVNAVAHLLREPTYQDDWTGEDDIWDYIDYFASQEMTVMSLPCGDVGVASSQTAGYGFLDTSFGGMDMINQDHSKGFRRELVGMPMVVDGVIVYHDGDPLMDSKGTRIISCLKNGHRYLRGFEAPEEPCCRSCGAIEGIACAPQKEETATEVVVVKSTKNSYAQETRN